MKSSLFLIRISSRENYFNFIGTKAAHSILYVSTYFSNFNFVFGKHLLFALYLYDIPTQKRKYRIHRNRTNIFSLLKYKPNKYTNCIFNTSIKKF